GLGHREIVDLAQPCEQYFALLLRDVAVWMDVGKDPARHIMIDERLGAHGLASAIWAHSDVEHSRQQAIQQLWFKCHVHRLIHGDRECLAAGACERHFRRTWHSTTSSIYVWW